MPATPTVVIPSRAQLRGHQRVVEQASRGTGRVLGVERVADHDEQVHLPLGRDGDDPVEDGPVLPVPSVPPQGLPDVPVPGVQDPHRPPFPLCSLGRARWDRRPASASGMAEAHAKLGSAGLIDMRSAAPDHVGPPRMPDRRHLPGTACRNPSEAKSPMLRYHRMFHCSRPTTIRGACHQPLQRSRFLKFWPSWTARKRAWPGPWRKTTTLGGWGPGFLSTACQV